MGGGSTLPGAEPCGHAVSTDLQDIETVHFQAKVRSFPAEKDRCEQSATNVSKLHMSPAFHVSWVPKEVERGSSWRSRNLSADLQALPREARRNAAPALQALADDVPTLEKTSIILAEYGEDVSNEINTEHPPSTETFCDCSPVWGCVCDPEPRIQKYARKRIALEDAFTDLMGAFKLNLEETTAQLSDRCLLHVRPNQTTESKIDRVIEQLHELNAHLGMASSNQDKPNDEMDDETKNPVILYPDEAKNTIINIDESLSVLQRHREMDNIINGM